MNVLSILWCEQVNYAKLPDRLKEGRQIRIFPVLFTQGINEQQTIANTVGDSSLQEEINKENLKELSEYIRVHENYLADIGAKRIL